jgi:hypothetical protein
MVEGIMKPPQQLAAVELPANRDVPVELSYRPAGGATELGGAEVIMLTVQLNVAAVIDEPGNSIMRSAWRLAQMLP